MSDPEATHFCWMAKELVTEAMKSCCVNLGNTSKEGIISCSNLSNKGQGPWGERLVRKQREVEIAVDIGAAQVLQ